MGSTDESYSLTSYEPNDYYLMETCVESLTESLTQQQFPEQRFLEDVDCDDAALEEMLYTPRTCDESYSHTYERRFGQPFKGPITPFGSLVEHYPITAKDQSRIHQFGKKVLPGLFLGYPLYAGGIWKGDIVVADLEELETMDASEI